MNVALRSQGEAIVTSYFADKVALVTGGGSGIGRTTALAFAREGASAVVAGRGADQLGETVKLIEAAGGTGSAVPTDVTDADGVARLVASAIERHGRLDIAFNNAGYFAPPAKIADIDEATWSTMLAVNVTGLWRPLHPPRPRRPPPLSSARTSSPTAAPPPRNPLPQPRPDTGANNRGDSPPVPTCVTRRCRQSRPGPHKAQVTTHAWRCPISLDLVPVSRDLVRFACVRPDHVRHSSHRIEWLRQRGVLFTTFGSGCPGAQTGRARRCASCRSGHSANRCRTGRWDRPRRGDLPPTTRTNRTMTKATTLTSAMTKADPQG